MKYNTYSLPLKLDFDIPRQELNDLWPSFFSIGSCFAENQSNTLKKLGFSVYSNPFGIMYNPLSIERFFYRIAYKKEYTPQDFIHEKSYFSLEHHGHFKYTDEEKAIANRINAEVGYEGTAFVGDVLQDAGNVDLGLRSAKK